MRGILAPRMDDLPTIGARLRQARKQARLSQTEVATKIGKGLTTIQTWESGSHQCGATDLAKLVMVYREAGVEISADEILGLPLRELPSGKFIVDVSLADRILAQPDKVNEALGGEVLNWSPDPVVLAIEIPEGVRVLDEAEARRLASRVEAKLDEASPRTIDAWRRLWSKMSEHKNRGSGE